MTNEIKKAVTVAFVFAAAWLFSGFGTADTIAMTSVERVHHDGRGRNRTVPREGIDPTMRFKVPIACETIVNDTQSVIHVFVSPVLKGIKR